MALSHQPPEEHALQIVPSVPDDVDELQFSLLPNELMEMILQRVDTGTLLHCRQVSRRLNQVAIMCLRKRHVSLRKDWFQRKDRMEIFELFPSVDLTPWSAFHCPPEFHIPFYWPGGIRKRFLEKFGPWIWNCIFEGQANTPRTPRPLEILDKMRNVVEITIPGLKGDYDNGDVAEFKLTELKIVRFTCAGFENEYKLATLLGLTTRNLERVEITNCHLADYKRPERVLDVLQHVSKIVMTLDYVNYLPLTAMKKYKLHIVDLSVSSLECKELCHPNLLQSLECLSRLHIRMVIMSEGAATVVTIPPLPALSNVEIGVDIWHRRKLEQMGVNLSISFTSELVPNLMTVDLTSKVGTQNIPENLADGQAGTATYRIFGFSWALNGQGEWWGINFRPKKNKLDWLDF